MALISNCTAELSLCFRIWFSDVWASISGTRQVFGVRSCHQEVTWSTDGCWRSRSSQPQHRWVSAFEQPYEKTGISPIRRSALQLLQS